MVLSPLALFRVPVRGSESFEAAGNSRTTSQSETTSCAVQSAGDISSSYPGTVPVPGYPGYPGRATGRRAHGRHVHGTVVTWLRPATAAQPVVTE
eukprot:2368676-Rhodomonas_salina.1